MKLEEIENPTLNDILQEMPFGIVVLDGDEVKHICLYENFPTQNDCELLIEELKTDDELGLVGYDFSKLSFHPTTGELLKISIDTFNGETST